MPNDVTYTLPLSKIRRGDRVAATGAIIDQIETKQKWAIVFYGGENPDPAKQRVPIDLEVEIVRSEPTPEETAALEAKIALDQMQQCLTEFLKDPSEILAEAIAKYQSRDEKWVGDIVSSYTLEKFLKAQALHYIGLQVQYMQHKGHSLLDSWAQWYARRSDMMNRRVVDPFSRSTSTLANLEEDTMRWAINFVMHEGRWNHYAMADAIMARAAEILKEEEESRGRC